MDTERTRMRKVEVVVENSPKLFFSLLATISLESRERMNAHRHVGV
jgi:hypothetical protein